MKSETIRINNKLLFVVIGIVIVRLLFRFAIKEQQPLLSLTQQLATQKEPEPTLIADRVEFKASARGSGRKQVNPCYTSQTCPSCGFVHRKNRNGDRFHCQFCRQVGHSDEIAALNLLERADDPDILLWMPKERVKLILLDRFSRRLESWKFEFSPDVVNFTALAKVGLKIPTTVPGRTQDTQPLAVGGTAVNDIVGSI